MINAEYEDMDESDGKLDLADTDNLPWLESDDADEEAGGYDIGQFILFAAGLVALGGVLLGGVWWLTNRSANSEAVADGSVIAAPEGPIKERPEDPGGKTFAGTGNVAPVVGEGGSRSAVVADTQMPPLPGDPPVSKPAPVAAVPAATASRAAPAATASRAIPAAAASPAANVSGVGVQLAAYGTRARAEQGWSDVQRRTDKLAGARYRIVEGRVDIGTVYRLQAVVGTRAEADRLCAALKSDGVDCQVK